MSTRSRQEIVFLCEIWTMDASGIDDRTDAMF